MGTRSSNSDQYRKPVAFGEHRMMLRPRDGYDQSLIDANLVITPTPISIRRTQDAFGNHLDVARFADRAMELRFESTIRLDHSHADIHDQDIEESARTYPFSYGAEEMPGLTPFIGPRSTHPELDRWAGCFLRADGLANSRELLVDMTQTIKRTFKHVARHEKGIQDPVRTLTLARGSCRDLAVLMIAALRSLGIAARFVSGYLHLADDVDDRAVGGNTHAWVQVYVPGPGMSQTSPNRRDLTPSRSFTRIGTR